VCKNVQFTEIEAIIFDKDGTLVNSQQFLYELAQTRAHLIEREIPGIKQQLLSAFGIENEQLNSLGLMAVGSHQENKLVAAGYIAATGRTWFEALSIAHQAFQEANDNLPKRAEAAPIFTGVKEVLTKLSQKGFKLGILSADSTPAVEEFVNRYGLSNYIQLAMGVDSQLTKPHPDLFRQACKALGVTPEKTVMVGDSQGDIDMAKNAGAAGTIGINCYNQELNHLVHADVIINSLTDLDVLT
jgi:phosphoglycolate phosphatase